MFPIDVRLAGWLRRISYLSLCLLIGFFLLSFFENISPFLLSFFLFSLSLFLFDLRYLQAFQSQNGDARPLHHGPWTRFPSAAGADASVPGRVRRAGAASGAAEGLSEGAAAEGVAAAVPVLVRVPPRLAVAALPGGGPPLLR